MEFNAMLGSCLSADCVHRMCTFFVPGDNDAQYCEGCGCSRHHHRLMGFARGHRVFDTSHILPRERFYDWELRANNCREMQTQVDEVDIDAASATSDVSTTSYPRSGIPRARSIASSRTTASSRTNVFGDTSLLYRPANVFTSGRSYRYDTPSSRKYEDFLTRNTAGVPSSADTEIIEGIDADYPAKRPKTED